MNLKNIFKKIQIYIDAKPWGEGDKRLCAKMLFDLILFISSFLLSFLLAPNAGLFPSYCGSSSPSVSWGWFSSRLLTSEDIIWHQNHSCFWALRLRLRLITIHFLWNWVLKPRFSGPIPYSQDCISDPFPMAFRFSPGLSRKIYLTLLSLLPCTDDLEYFYSLALRLEIFQAFCLHGLQCCNLFCPHSHMC